MIEHDGCKGCRYEKESADSKHCIGCLQNATDKYVRMTNYDAIKNMSVEEIARFMSEKGQHALMFYTPCTLKELGFSIEKDVEISLNWLNSECDLMERVEE